MVKDSNSLKSQQSKRPKRLGTTFHRTFWLSRTQVRQLLSAAASSNPASSSENCLTAADIREKTQLGTVQVEAMPRYARACGLVDDKLCLTAFGREALEKDPLLETSATKWLMHYFISANHGAGPPFWSNVVSTRFRSGDEVNRDDIATDIEAAHLEAEGKEIKANYAKSTATIFLKTYIESDALGSLGILEETEDGHYLILEPDPPSVWVFGLALLDYWQARYGFDRLTINLDDLYEDGGLGDIFLIGGGRINQYLHRLQEEGVVELFRVAPPYQLVLTQNDPQPLLKRVYALDNA